MASTHTHTKDIVSFVLDQHEEVKRLFTAVDSSTGDARHEAFQCLVRLLAVHETAEEEVLWPTVRSVLPEGETLVEERKREEDEAKRVLSDLEKLGPDAAGFAPMFSTFKQAVVRHANAEQQQILEPLRAKLDPERAETMARVFAAAEAMAPTHPHPHSPESALGNVIVGPFVAIADRVRDAIKAAIKS